MNNDQEKKVLSQCLADALAQIDNLRRQLQEKDRKYNELLLEHEKMHLEYRQQNELLLQELSTTKQRYNNLKRQEMVLKSIQEEESRPRPFEEMSSVISLDEGRSKESKVQEDKVAQLQKQINILTDYISLKESTYNQKIRKLEEQLKSRWTDKPSQSRMLSPLNSLENLSPIKQIDSDNRVKQLEREKRQLEAKVQKCTNIVKQLEEYYTKEIEKLSEENSEMKASRSQSQQSELRLQISALQDRLELAISQKEQSDKDLEDMQKNFEFALDQIQKKRENQRTEVQFSHYILMQTIDKKYDNCINDMKAAYEQKISEYEDRVNFLMLKLEHMQSNTGGNMFDLKNIGQMPRFLLPNRTHLAESKFVDRNDAFRMTGSSFASSIKESLSKKNFKEDLTKSLLDRSGLSNSRQEKTPIKNVRQTGNIFSDRTNLI